ncbi:MAG: flagellar filament capping protein FliD [Deltaproteobacteria bacterium]|nr:flagellar filament capping protein FliD [Deltaproteobacteria bacterium]
MSSSTNLISGLSSGFDWRSMIDQLIAIEHKRVDLVENKKSDYESKLAEWQSFNTKLLSLKTAAERLKDSEDFYLYLANMTTNSSTVSASDLMSVSTSSSAAIGSYAVKISALATAQKLSSASFTGIDEALGSSYAGDILINGKVVTIDASDDLADIRDKINNLNAGTNPTHVTASIVNYGTTGYRLIITNDTTGAEGISLLNASATDVLGNLGFTETATDSYEVKNAVTGGAQSDRFTSVSQSIEDLLGLSAGQASTTLTIQDSSGNNSDNISIDLATDDLYAIRDAINNNKGSANISASVVTEIEDETTYYRLQVDGLHATDPFSDQNNIFQTLGMIKGGVGDVLGITGTNEMTTGGQVIDADTLLADIDGYMTWTSGDKIDFTGTDTSNGAVSSTFNITAASTVQDLLTAIESAYGNVTASISGDGKIQIVDDTTTRPSYLDVTLTDTITDGSLDFGTFGAATTVRKREIIAGQNASIEVDGVAITRTDNTIDDVISGVTLNLLKVDPGTMVTLNIDRDIEGITENINTFVTAYNAVSSYIHEQQSYDTDNEETGGVLFGDGTLSSVESDLTSIIVQSVWGVSSEFSIMGLVGINVDNEGRLSIDNDTLNGYLQSNFNDVKNLFTANGTTDTGTLQYISHSHDTQADEYTIHIDNAATQSTSTSDTAVSGTLGSDETLTITAGDMTATFDLTSSMTITDIVNAVNGEMDSVYTETLLGLEQLYSDVGQTTTINSSTTWDSIYDSEGASANLVNGDVITFSGTSRSGESVSGSYTANNVTEDTVQGLLSAVEEAFGYTIDVTINTSGQIVVTDKNSGNSQLSLTFDCSQSHDLDFGSVLTSNTGGQEGRYAMDITASADSGDHLVLTHNSYGSSYSFTISETADLLWTGGDQSVENGEDVAGTINGEVATGSGQVLTGDDGEATTDGLVIKYTGTSEGLDVGTVTLTFGVAELFNRALFNITDTYEGYVAFKTDSLKDSINDFETKIENMEAFLDRKTETMINRFVAMELALSTIQSQSEWLTSQLNAAQNAWYY